MHIFVANLSPEVTTEELRPLFTQYGSVVGITLIPDLRTGRPRGFGFVNMPHRDEAQRAIRGLRGFPLQGRRLDLHESGTHTKGAHSPMRTD